MAKAKMKRRKLSRAQMRKLSPAKLFKEMRAAERRSVNPLPVDERCGPGCPGWAHFNIGESTEGIERCDECNAYEDDSAAKVAHDKVCNCGMLAYGENVCPECGCYGSHLCETAGDEGCVHCNACSAIVAGPGFKPVPGKEG